MVNPIEANAYRLLKLIIDADQEQYENTSLQEMSGLSPRDLSDAVEYLGDVGAVEVIKTLGTAPFGFNSVSVESRGRYLYHEIENRNKEQDKESIMLPARPLNPIGSPYGFTEIDWETVSLQKEENQALYVVLGMQFNSNFYDSDLLAGNIQTILQNAVEEYNKQKQEGKIILHFEKLAAGLGEHLFNQIDRSIIGADIAVFETSDLNPNVMLEMGVALTWGVRVVPFKAKGQPSPPSDISGQTWVEYENSAKTINDDKFDRKLLIMIERVISAKGRIEAREARVILNHK